MAYNIPANLNPMTEVPNEEVFAVGFGPRVPYIIHTMKMSAKSLEFEWEMSSELCGLIDPSSLLGWKAI